jgi:hypothetical protein
MRDAVPRWMGRLAGGDLKGREGWGHGWVAGLRRRGGERAFCRPELFKLKFRHTRGRSLFALLLHLLLFTPSACVPGVLLGRRVRAPESLSGVDLAKSVSAPALKNKERVCPIYFPNMAVSALYAMSSFGLNVRTRPVSG